jgi:SAM-dependent methyltransferase
MDYHDPAIAAIYELANPLEQDAEFYLSLAGQHPRSILDLGCGTGTLCCALAERGHRVTGVDPAASMLAIARKKPAAARVRWIESSAQSYSSEDCFDLIFMTGHAFQVLLTDPDMLATLRTMRRHLAQRGSAVFETRNPYVDWIREWTGRSRILPGGEITESLDITAADTEFISLQTSYRLPDRTLTTNSTLRFSTREHVESLITRSGLSLRSVFGDWNSSPFETAHSREMIFISEIVRLGFITTSEGPAT